MTTSTTTIAFAHHDIPVHALTRLKADMIAALVPRSDVRLDMSSCRSADIRIVQLVAAAREYAAEVGADFMLSGPPGFDIERLLSHAGLSDHSEKNFWLQGINCR